MGKADQGSSSSTSSSSYPQVFVAEGEPAMFECRVEPKHDLNLSVRWYRNDEELVGFIMVYIMIIYDNNI